MVGVRWQHGSQGGQVVTSPWCKYVLQCLYMELSNYCTDTTERVHSVIEISVQNIVTSTTASM